MISNMNRIKRDRRGDFKFVALYGLVVFGAVAIYLLALNMIYTFVFKTESPSLEFYIVNALLVAIFVLILLLLHSVRFFMRQRRPDNVDNLVSKMNSQVLGTHDLERALETMAGILVDELRVPSAYFVIMHSSDEVSLVAGQARQKLNHKELLLINKTVVGGVGRVLGQEAISVNSLPKEMLAKKILKLHKIGTVAKMFAGSGNERRLIGFLLVGQSNSRRRVDSRTLSIVADLAAIAITNISYYSY